MELKDRAKMFEDKFAHDDEVNFKVMALRNKMFGQWAADALCKKDSAAEEYAKEVVLSDFEEAGDDDVLRKVMADFEAAGLKHSEEEVREKMDALLVDAKAQIFEGA